MKITQEQIEKGQELYQQLVHKAHKNASFKEQLITNPEVVIQKILGEDFKEASTKKVVVEDQSDETIVFLNIPKKIDFDDLELTENQLQLVSGGGPTYDLGVVWMNVMINSALIFADSIQKTFK